MGQENLKNSIVPIDQKPLELSDDFNYALDLLEKTRKSMFITGRAGTGKSTLLRLFRKSTRKKTVVLAPTGIAALNVKGQTIHSFFGFPPRPDFQDHINKRRNRSLYKKMEVLIIDEISMVRADIIDGINRFLQINRENSLPFGGVQMVFFGDLFQLPPVVASPEEKMLFQSYYESPYFFSGKVYTEDGFEMEMLELRKVYRQEARQFIRLLDAVRTNRIDYDDLEDLNERHLPDFELEDYYITLSTRNSIVNRINARQLERLDAPNFKYLASVTGKFENRLFPTEQILQLKVGAQVMFIKNDPERHFVNGTIGKVISLSEDVIKVEVEDFSEEKEVIEVTKMDWEVLKYKTNVANSKAIETEVIGTFTQYPLRLAWAITIHKSQGKTFDKVIIDLGRGAFEHGQTYVALSRCRTLEGIVLKQALRAQDVQVDDIIVEFYEQSF